jgi:O-methyltransferase
MSFGKRVIKKFLRSLNYDLVKLKNAPRRYPVELMPAECEILEYVLENNLTLVSYERLLATLMTCKYVITNDIQGDFVECGVWRGGNSIVAAEMIKLYQSEKKVWMYDTFTGMAQPTDIDVDIYGVSAYNEYNTSKREGYNAMFYASLDDVKNQFRTRDLLGSNVQFIQGDVAETLNSANSLPESISVLRLDTDWYESTKVELEILYPKLSLGGCLIVDDYGHWEGSKRAVDEYFNSYKPKPYLQYTDYTGRLILKTK